MTTSYWQQQSVNEAKSRALSWQTLARNHVPTPDEIDKERVRGLGCDGATVAEALASVTGWPAYATDPDDPEKATSGPLRTAAEVFAHFRNRQADGAGLQLGRQPSDAVLVAVCGTRSAWSEWVAEEGTHEQRRVDGYGQSVFARVYRDMPRFVTINWQPSSSPSRMSAAFGEAGLAEQAQAMRGSRIGAGERGWVLWAVPAHPDGRTLVFPRRRSLGHGLTAIGDGLVPLYARRADGWVLRHSGIPQVQEMPPWLIGELGGRWVK